MSDYNSSLPVRTENNGDVVSRISDGTVTSQLLKVESDGSINVNDNGGSLTVDAVALDIRLLTNADVVTVEQGTSPWVVSATDLDIRDLAHTQDSVKIGDGTDFLAIASDGSIAVTDNGTTLSIDDGGGSITVDGSVSISGSVTVTASDLDIRDLSHTQDSIKVGDGTDFLAIASDGSIAVTDNGTTLSVDDGGGSITVDGSVTVSAADLDIRDLSHSQDSVKIGDGTDFLAVNADGSINVVVSGDVQGSEVCDHQTSAAVAAGATVNLDYTVTTAKTLIIEQVFASGSGKIKVEVKVETAPASGTYTTKYVAFNSTATPNCEIPIKKLLKQVATAKVRISITNKDNQAQDVYSTLSGTEI